MNQKLNLLNISLLNILQIVTQYYTTIRITNWSIKLYNYGNIGPKWDKSSFFIWMDGCVYVYIFSIKLHTFKSIYTHCNSIHYCLIILINYNSTIVSNLKQSSLTVYVNSMQTEKNTNKTEHKLFVCLESSQHSNGETI